MRSDEEMEAMEAMETGEDWAIVRALKSGATPAPQFRARFKQSFLSEAELDARRRRASFRYWGFPGSMSTLQLPAPLRRSY